MPNWTLDTLSDLRADTSKDYRICSSIWQQSCERTAFRGEGQSIFSKEGYTGAGVKNSKRTEPTVLIW